MQHNSPKIVPQSCESHGNKVCAKPHCLWGPVQYDVVYEAYGAKEGRHSEQHRLLAKLHNRHQLIRIHHLDQAIRALFDQRFEQPGTLLSRRNREGCTQLCRYNKLLLDPAHRLRDVGHLHIVHAPARCRHPLGDALPQRLHARRVGAGASFLRPLCMQQQYNCATACAAVCTADNARLFWSCFLLGYRDGMCLLLTGR